MAQEDSSVFEDSSLAQPAPVEVAAPDGSSCDAVTTNIAPTDAAPTKTSSTSAAPIDALLMDTASMGRIPMDETPMDTVPMDTVSTDIASSSRVCVPQSSETPQSDGETVGDSSAQPSAQGTHAPVHVPWMTRIRDYWRRWVVRRVDAIPLSTKIVTCMLAVLMVGALGLSFSLRQMVGNYLMSKTDSQLAQQAPLVLRNIDYLMQVTNGNRSSNGPTDYFVQIRTPDAVVQSTLVPVLHDGVVSQPTLPPDGSMGNIHLGEAFTTPAKVQLSSGTAERAVLTAARSPWRVMALRLEVDGQTRGIVFIGLSLGDQIDTINTLTRYCLVMSVAIVLLGGVVGTLIVQRTLLPLKRMERTAAKIAAGDLTQRVPSAPEHTEVGSLALSLNTMLARIEHSFREQQATTDKMKRFVSDASHELRTPLAAIHGYAELYAMQRHRPGALERADESIAHIEASSARMTVLVEDLLSLARLDEGRGIDVTQQVPLTSLIADAADDLHALDPQREVRCGTIDLRPTQGEGFPSVCFSQGTLPQISLSGDGSRLRQVVTNIIGNIHRYTPADSSVEIALSAMTASLDSSTLSSWPSTQETWRRFLQAAEVGGAVNVGTRYAVLQFIDHGPGVPRDMQEKIFERFYTADPSRARQKGGTGLGMAIAQSVVKAHQGLICASETVGGGLTLTVVLPMGVVDAAPTVSPSEAYKPQKSQKPTRRVRRHRHDDAVR